MQPWEERSVFLFLVKMESILVILVIFSMCDVVLNEEIFPYCVDETGNASLLFHLFRFLLLEV